VTDSDRDRRSGRAKWLAPFQKSRFRLLYIAPALALIALMAWALASPMGSSPDDDFHLTSIWCANASKTYDCAPGKTAATRVVPDQSARAFMSAFYANLHGIDAASMASAYRQAAVSRLADTGSQSFRLVLQ